MKLGILTFHNSSNYGAVLQTFALQQKLNDLGYENEIIDYVCANKVKMYRAFNFKKSLKGNIIEIIEFPYKKIKNNIMNSFMSSEYKVSEQFYSSAELSRNHNKWDMVICGSDQIWNYENTKFDTTYLLDFISDKQKKMSYAASFGLSKISDEAVNRYRELLNDIEYLSIREKQGKEIIKEITGRDCKVVLDPTLLLNKSQWIDKLSNIESKKSIEYEYVLVYTLFKNEKLEKIAFDLAKKKGMKLIKISNTSRDFMSSMYTPRIPDPYEFINLINNAQYIVTNSFHGAAFSINLNKKFYVDSGEISKYSSRISNLLNICGLDARLVKDWNSVDWDEEIDYNSVNISLDIHRKSSIDYLISSIDDYRDKREK